MYLLFFSPLWVITSVNLLLDNLRLHFTFALKLPISNFKRWSLILVSYSVLIQFKENYLLCFQGCGFSILRKCKSYFLFSRYSKSCGEGKDKQKMFFIWEDMITAKMNHMAKRCYRVPCMPRLHSLFTKEKVLILIVCWHVLVSPTQWTTQVGVLL